MTRFATTAVLMALTAGRGDAQTAPVAPPAPRTAPAPGVTPAPIVIPITSAKPPAGYYKSGGVLVGADGYYPFDTGQYLLGGFDGLARYSGTYYMVSPGAATALVQPSTVEPVPDYAPPASGHRGRFFHRR